ncbi:hypothetical protein ACHAO8_005074 [Botrytis cinerea]
MDIKPTKELLYAMAVVIVTIVYFAFTMAPTAKTTKVIEPTKTTKINPLPKKLKCFRIRGIPIETTKKSLEEELMRCLPTYGSDCSITLARSSSTRLMATLNSFETPTLPYTIDHDFLGVTPLFEGDESFVDSIVFVPGLGSHPIGSFKAKHKDYVWIRDSLPTDISSARILAYGYDTSILDRNAKQSISDLAKAFLSSVIAFRSATKASQRPLIFVAHSLGGLLVKEALYIAMISGKNPDNVDFFKSSYGLMFFGVPNLGLNNKALMQIVAGGLNEQMIKDLQVADEDHEPTQFLSTIKQNFKQCCKRGQFQIRSYYEQKETQMVRKLDNGSLVKDGPLCFMVSKSSACQIGIDDNFCYEEGLPRDHSDLVKFSDQSDVDYIKVLHTLKGLVDRAPNVIEARFASIKKLSSAEKRHWDDLNMPPYGNFKETKKVRTAVEGTLQWLVTDQPLEFQDHSERLQKSDFIEWRDSNQSCVLLITGTPGQGKSVLSNFVIDHLQEQQKPQNKIIYYFCNIKNDKRYWTASFILRSFIVQLCEDRRLYQKLPNRFQDKDEKEFFTDSLDNLWRVFLDLISTDIYNRIYCIIDGLDVYDTEMKSLLEYLNEGLKTIRIGEPFLKLLCTSRPEEFVMDIGFSPSKTLCASEDDLTIFIESELCSFRTKFTDDMKEYILKAAKEKAGTTFLWISILLREVQGLRLPSRKDVEKKMKQLPLEINDLYKSLLQKVLGSPKDIAILTWITYAARPLSFKELEVALAIGMTENATSWKDCKEEKIVLNAEVIQTTLGSLIDVIGPNPFLIHQTLRDFLKSSGILEKAEILNQFERPGMLLANTCISYLNFDDIAEAKRLKMLDEMSLHSYAAEFWYEHIDTLNEAQNNFEQLKCLSSAKGQAIWLPSNTRYSWRYGKIPVSIWTLAIIINKEWFARLLTNTIPSRITEELGDHYILPAAESSINVFRELLNGLYSARVSITKEVIEAAARNNESGEEVLELLFEERGAEVMITEEVVKAAAGNRRSGKEVMMLLLEKRRAEVMITEEVVKAAAEDMRNGKEVMMLLLEKRGAEVAITKEVVELIIGRFDKEVMMLLLEKRGAEVMITEEVVKAAAGNWRSGKEVMMLLLEKRGAEVMITEEVVKAAVGNEESGEEILMLLFEKRKAEVMITEEVVKAAAGNGVSGKRVMMLLLEEQGAEVMITEEIVKAAAENRNNGKEIMKLLFEKRGAEVMITEEVMKAAAGNWHGKEMMMLLLEKRGAEVMITEEVVKAAAGNWHGKEMMMLLLEKQGAEVMITEEVVKAAVGNWRSGKEVMMLLLEKRGAEVAITKEVVELIIGRFDKEVMMLLLEKRGAEVMITEEVVKAAAVNISSGKEIMMLLLEKRGAEVMITEEVVKAVAGNWYEKEVMMLLLEKRGAEVMITEEVMKAAAGNWFGKEVMMLLLEKQGAEVMITEEVVKAAVGNWRSGKEMIMLLLEKRGVEVMITEEVMKVAVGNERSGEEILMLLFEERGAEIMITEEVVKAAVGNEESGEEIMMLLFEKRGAEVMITEEVVKTIAGNKKSGKEVMMLLLEKRGAEVVITEEVVELIADRFDEKVITLLFEKQKADIAITKEVIKAAATNG